jgi:hypothetical protein
MPEKHWSLSVRVKRDVLEFETENAEDWSWIELLDNKDEGELGPNENTSILGIFGLFLLWHLKFVDLSIKWVSDLVYPLTPKQGNTIWTPRIVNAYDSSS